MGLALRAMQQQRGRLVGGMESPLLGELLRCCASTSRAPNVMLAVAPLERPPFLTSPLLLLLLSPCCSEGCASTYQELTAVLGIRPAVACRVRVPPLCCCASSGLSGLDSHLHAIKCAYDVLL